MSADNWAVCPKCGETEESFEEKRRKLGEEVHRSYGKVSATEWQALKQKYDTMERGEPETTFREDYEIYGAEEGVIHVRYSGHCDRCGTSCEFTYDRPFV